MYFEKDNPEHINHLINSFSQSIRLVSNKSEIYAIVLYLFGYRIQNGEDILKLKIENVKKLEIKLLE